MALKRAMFQVQTCCLWANSDETYLNLTRLVRIWFGEAVGCYLPGEPDAMWWFPYQHTSPWSFALF